MIPGAFPIAAAIGGSRLEYNGRVTSATTAITVTLLNVPLGEEDPSRRIYMAVGSGAASPLASLTLDGNAMTLDGPGATNSGALSIFSLAYPSGTSGTVVINYPSLTGGGHAVFSYAAYNQINSTVFATTSVRSTSGATVVVSRDTSSNGFVIGVSSTYTPTTRSWTGLTQNDVVTPISGLFTYSTASAQNVLAETPRAITATATGAVNNSATVISMP